MWESSGSSVLWQSKKSVWTWRVYWHPKSMREGIVGTETLGFWKAYVWIKLWKTGNARERFWDVIWFGSRRDRISCWLAEFGLVGKKSSCSQEKGLKTRWENVGCKALVHLPSPYRSVLWESVGNLAALAVNIRQANPPEPQVPPFPFRIKMSIKQWWIWIIWN